MSEKKQPKWNIVFHPLLKSIRTEIIDQETNQVVYEFVEMNEQSALRVVRIWIDDKKKEINEAKLG